MFRSVQFLEIIICNASNARIGQQLGRNYIKYNYTFLRQPVLYAYTCYSRWAIYHFASSYSSSRPSNRVRVEQILTDALLVIVYNVFTNIVIREDDAVTVTGRPIAPDADQYPKHHHC